MTFTLVETHQKSWFHLSEDLSKGVDFTLVETHQKSGFHLSEDPSKGVLLFICPLFFGVGKTVFSCNHQASISTISTTTSVPALLIYPQAIQTHVTRKGCKVIYIP